MENNKNIFLGFAWISLICGICSWVFMPFVFFGLETIAIITAVIALIGLRKSEKKQKRVAKIGLLLGAAKILFIGWSFICLFLAFMKNPVAH